MTLAYAEEFKTVDEAFAREKQVQGWNRQKKLALIEMRGVDLPELSKSKAGRLREEGGPSTGSGTQQG